MKSAVQDRKSTPVFKTFQMTHRYALRILWKIASPMRFEVCKQPGPGDTKNWHSKYTYLSAAWVHSTMAEWIDDSVSLMPTLHRQALRKIWEKPKYLVSFVVDILCLSGEQELVGGWQKSSWLTWQLTFSKFVSSTSRDSMNDCTASLWRSLFKGSGRYDFGSRNGTSVR